MSLAAAAKLAQIQRRQLGLFTLEQAGHAGLSAAAVRHGARRGRWRRVFRGVYADAASPTTPEQLALAACLASPGAVASHETAAGLWGMDIALTGPVHVTLPPRHDSKVNGIVPHRTNRLDRTDVTRLGVIPITTPARTVSDLAESSPVPTLERYVDDMRRRGLLEPERLVRFLETPWARNQPGSDALRDIARSRCGLARLHPGLETPFLRLIVDANLPIPVAQFPIRTPTGVRKVDFAYPDRLLAIELDGYEWRTADRAGFDDEHVRQNAISEKLLSFRRFTSTQVEDDALYVVCTLASALGLWPTRWTAGRWTAGRKARRYTQPQRRERG